jgi:uncharacterized RDD family membrane protein YckC
MSIGIEPTKTVPRYLARRITAFLIDLLIFGLVVTAIVVILSNLFPPAAPYLPYGIVRITTCKDVTQAPQVAQYIQDLKVSTHETASVIFCKIESPLIPPRYLIKATAVSKSAHIAQERYITQVTDPMGKAISVNPLYEVASGTADLLASISIFALLLSMWGSPGKRLFKLQVQREQRAETTACSPPGFGASVKRETLKLMMLVFNQLQSIGLKIIMAISGSTGAHVNWEALSAYHNTLWIYFILMALIAVFWYLWPLVFWKGATFYDRILGLKVVRIETPRPSIPD